MASKSTNAIKLQRIKEVSCLLIMATPRHEIIYELTERWKCSARNVDKYINAAKQTIQKNFNEETIADMNSKYDYLWIEAIRDGDKLLAKQIIDSKTKLKGIVDKVEVNVNMFNTSWGSDDVSKN